MTIDSVHYLPVAVFILLPGTFLTTYVIAVVLGHVEIGFPYISDTGTHTPESCIFSQLLNIVSFLVVVTMYVRYKQIEQYYRDNLSIESENILNFNRKSLFVGVTSAFGLSIVANFQETNVFRVHMVGAIIAFGFGVIYSWIQTLMSFKMIPLVNTRCAALLRLTLSLIMTCTFASSSVCGPMALREFHGADPTNWKREDGGWHLHVISTVCEWISALSLDCFILTFAREMHSISLTSPRVMFVIERLTLPTIDSSMSPMNHPNYDQIRNVATNSSTSRNATHSSSSTHNRTNRSRNKRSLTPHSRSSSLEPLVDPATQTGHHESFTSHSSTNQVIIQ